MHGPVPDRLDTRFSAGGLVIVDNAQRVADLDAVTRLLCYLPDGPLKLRLTGDELALRNTPVVVPGPVDDGHLNFKVIRGLVCRAPEDASGGFNYRGAYLFNHSRFFFRFIAFH